MANGKTSSPRDGRPKKRTSRSAQSVSLYRVDGIKVDVEVRRNPRARRLILRVDPRSGRAVVTVPSACASAEGLAFARSKRAWIEAQLNGAPPPTPFADGVVFPYQSRDITIRRVTVGRGAQLDGDQRTLLVASAAEHVNRRVVDWVKASAREALTQKTDDYAGMIGARRGPVRIRDQMTRWGSCSSDGVLSFSWRLMLAPPFVLDYVAAHECAHLRHMDHSAAFWATLGEMNVPRAKAERWLKENGATLFRWGAQG
ncbi:MAG: SprT family zinc-dependent metalloprotease [Pseudomonadota bacterium]